VTAQLFTALVLAQEKSPGPGRGENPDDGGGILIIVGIILAVLLVGLVLGLIFARGRASPIMGRRREHKSGRVGRQG
jgi:hypothetical protein